MSKSSARPEGTGRSVSDIANSAAAVDSSRARVVGDPATSAGGRIHPSGWSPPIGTASTIREPVRIEEIQAAIRVTDGDAIAIDAQDTKREHDRLARAGFNVEPTCAVATAALGAYRERGTLDENEDVVVPLTGTGLKN